MCTRSLRCGGCARRVPAGLGFKDPGSGATYVCSYVCLCMFIIHSLGTLHSPIGVVASWCYTHTHPHHTPSYVWRVFGCGCLTTNHLASCTWLVANFFSLVLTISPTLSAGCTFLRGGERCRAQVVHWQCGVGQFYQKGRRKSSMCCRRCNVVIFSAPDFRHIHSSTLFYIYLHH